ncbi:hypothetical protein P4C99_04865, partial [Pontiellaceae bacterium B1224]|nr:hypothetical protein [Pontiellaceae bacterium B1224]
FTGKPFFRRNVIHSQNGFPYQKLINENIQGYRCPQTDVELSAGFGFQCLEFSVGCLDANYEWNIEEPTL